MRKDNTTGITGVAKAKKGFRAYVTFRQNKFPLGNYKTIEEAAAARKKADDILLKTDISEEEMISELKKLHDRNLKIRKKDNVDITGQTFGKWYVIGPSKTKPYYHECKCQGCGIIRDVATSALRGGRTKSCHKCAVIGHSKTSSATAERMKKNAQEKIGKTINGWRVIDVYLDSERESYMCRAICPKCGKETETLLTRLQKINHCSTCNRTIGIFVNGQNAVDCVDGSKLSSIKNRTEGKVNKNSTTGINGVNKLPNGRYRALINFRRKQYYIGTFDTIEEAAIARKEAERLLYEPFLAENAGWEDRIKEVISSALKEAERNR